jgi:hypothetical protein
MLIRVRYNEDTYGMVEDSHLETLISTHEIKEFLRSSGWVKIWLDPISGQMIERRRRGSLINLYV